LSAASSGGQGKLTHFMYFPWPPLVTCPLVSIFTSYLHILVTYWSAKGNYPTSNTSKYDF